MLTLIPLIGEIVARCSLALYVGGGVGGVGCSIFRWEVEGDGRLSGGCVMAAVVCDSGGGGGAFTWRLGGSYRP